MISLKVPAQSDPQKEAVSCLGFDMINKVFPQRDPGPARSKSAALAGNDDGIQENLSDTPHRLNVALFGCITHGEDVSIL